MTMKRLPATYFTAILLPLLLGACADFFQDRIPMGAGSAQSGSLGNLINPPRAVVIERLPPPAQLFVESGGSARFIRLGWTSVDGAASYVVERAAVAPQTDGSGNVSYPPPAEEDFEILESFVYGLSYTDTIFSLAGNPRYTSPEYLNRYYYRVRSENVGAGLEPSEATEAQWGVLFAPPRNLRAGTGDAEGKIKVEWDKAAGAAAYIVYRSTDENGSSRMELVRTPGLMYENIVAGADEGREFYFAVEALNAAGERSVSSGLTIGYSLMPGAPAKPEALLPADSGRGNSTSEIAVEWGAVAAADYYVVYRYSSSDSSLVRVAANVTGSSWTDLGPLEPYVYYYYRVQTVNEEDGKLIKSSLSPAVEAFILSPPGTAEALKSEGGGISIQWYPALGAPAEQASYSYLIEGAGSQYGPFNPVLTVSSPTAGEDGYIHADSVPSRPFYRIKTKNGSVESAPGTVFAHLPWAAVILDASQRVYFPDKSPNGNGVYPVEITWQKPGGDNPDSYHVYRSTSPDSPGRPITENPIPASAESGGQFTWYDTNSTAKAGTRYYYRVLSLNALGKGKYYSETKTGYGALTHEMYFREYIKTVNKSLNKLVNMNKPGSTDKLGDESKSGACSGSIHYDSPDSVLSAIPPFDIYIRYSNYADFYINNDSALGRYFILNGESNTRVTSTSGAGTMHGTVTVTGMYPGTVNYGNIVISNQVASSGYYTVTPAGGSSGTVDWSLGKRD
jgi:fibronectin type 3 domain-containing protein